MILLDKIITAVTIFVIIVSIWANIFGYDNKFTSYKNSLFLLNIYKYYEPIK
jgi:hypothetical protein